MVFGLSPLLLLCKAPEMESPKNTTVWETRLLHRRFSCARQTAFPGIAPDVPLRFKSFDRKASRLPAGSAPESPGNGRRDSTPGYRKRHGLSKAGGFRGCNPPRGPCAGSGPFPPPCQGRGRPAGRPGLTDVTGSIRPRRRTRGSRRDSRSAQTPRTAWRSRGREGRRASSPPALYGRGLL